MSDHSGEGADRFYKHTLWYLHLLTFTCDQEIPRGNTNRKNLYKSITFY